MRMVTFALGLWLLGCETATAFNCTGIKLPWDIVVCADTELQVLADERLKAFEQAKARLSLRQVQQLREDQNAWVRSYSASCGVGATNPPPTPIPPAIIECFKTAGRARLAYLRAYGSAAGEAPKSHPQAAQLSASAPSASMAGPPPLEDWCKSIRSNPAASAPSRVICSDLELRGLAVTRQRAYNAARDRLNPNGQQQLENDQKAWVDSYLAACGIARTGPAPDPVPFSVKICFKDANVARIAYLREYGADPQPLGGSAVGRSDADPVQPTTLREEIHLENQGGIYVVPVRINGALVLRFIVDSGASDVLIPADVVLTLARTGTIADGDFIGEQTYTLGDGSKVKSARFVLRELQVGDQVIRNVRASIGPVQSVPLLGQSFLSRLSTWTLDNERHFLVLGTERASANAK
ncbi:MAG TPA: aspartyl protease family protein [Stellaceae bacterium]|nr:aspartyl protease family protein [Stellaceae bacterium]